MWFHDESNFPVRSLYAASVFLWGYLMIQVFKIWAIRHPLFKPIYLQVSQMEVITRGYIWWESRLHWERKRPERNPQRTLQSFFSWCAVVAKMVRLFCDGDLDGIATVVSAYIHTSYALTTVSVCGAAILNSRAQSVGPSIRDKQEKREIEKKRKEKREREWKEECEHLRGKRQCW